MPAYFERPLCGAFLIGQQIRPSWQDRVPKHRVGTRRASLLREHPDRTIRMDMLIAAKRGHFGSPKSRDSMSGQLVLTCWTPNVSRDNMPVQHARTEWTISAANHHGGAFSRSSSKKCNKNRLDTLAGTSWEDTERVHTGRIFFHFSLHDRKKEKDRSFFSSGKAKKGRFRKRPLPA